MSSRVKERYCSEPTTHLYYVALAEDAPSDNVDDVVEHKGVEIGLAPYILVFDKRSRMYFCCDKNRPFGVEMTSTPKK